MFNIGSDPHKEYPGLGKLAEECGELLQVIGRLMQTKGQSNHWVDPNLRDSLVEEIADVQAAIAFVVRNVFTADESQACWMRTGEKLQLFTMWQKEQSNRNP